MNNASDDMSSDTPEKLLEGHVYRLNGKKPVPCTFGEYIAALKSPANRIVEQTQVGDLLVSTIFTGIDHAFGTGEKQLFETAVFGLPDDLQPRWRFPTWNQAVREHRKLVLSLESRGPEALIAEVRQRQA